MNKRSTLFPIIGCMSLFVVAGCSPQEVREDTAEAASATERAVTQAGAVTGEVAAGAIETTGDAAAGATRTINNAASTATEATQDVVQSVVWSTKINAAFAADPRLSAWGLHTDVLPDKQTIVITGEVSSPGDRRYVTEVAARAIEPKIPILIINETTIDRD